jgi:hypothetical protein
MRRLAAWWRFVGVAVCGAAVWHAMLGEAVATRPPKTVDFNRDVRPILSEHCFRCHGPSAKDLKANLRIDDAASATKDRGGYRVITPGKAHLSRMFKRISGDPGMRMPPVDSGVKPLTKEQIETIRLWIEQGARYKAHWAFVPPADTRIPSVKNRTWVRNDIDAFVLSRLESANMAPEPQADKATLIRRVSLTLTGLPPSQKEVDEYILDKRPNAYERMVDHFLASQRYGEHQARYWLDAVRYGDTHGLHLDNERAIYPYRDWVVRAFNQDLPFDKFTLWQLAGDLLPKPTTEQLIATGYIRMNPTTNEGGAIEEEFQAKNTFDRVETTSTVFLGLTMTCARCHDHKYDPIPQRDYYRLFAFFNSTVDKPLDGNELTPAPVIKAASPQEDLRAGNLRGVIDALVQRVKPLEAKKWLSNVRVEPPKISSWEVSQPFTAASFDAAFSAEASPETIIWKPLMLTLGKSVNNLIGKENSSAYVRARIETSSKSDVTLRLSSDDAVRVWLNGAIVHDNKVLRGVETSFDSVKLPLREGTNELIIKIVNSAGPDGLFVSVGDSLSDRINAVYEKVAKNEGELELRKLYLEVGPASSDAVTYRKTSKELNDLLESVPFTLVAQELPKPRTAYILKRGEYNLPTTPVSRATPAALNAFPASQPYNRLGLAKWLTSPQNPLVARVFVNRIWQQHFGTGIVKTAEDFGSQGEWPSNPELLDCLAVSFIKNGWSLKKLHRFILCSSAFRQSASASKKKWEQDPENRLISRGPRFRLDAEVIRDQALYVSGLLKEMRGGKGFRPYQPAGLWEAIAFLESNTSKYMQDHGEGIYRRSLYLFWKRTSPHPAMLAFDAPMREACVVRRSRTNTPLQALVTMNEPAYLEAARVMAENVIRAAKSDARRIDWAFRDALTRRPEEEERKLLLNALARYRKSFAANKDEAASVLSVGESKRDERIPVQEHAAWMLVCSTILNMDEFLTQH